MRVHAIAGDLTEIDMDLLSIAAYCYAEDFDTEIWERVDELLDRRLYLMGVRDANGVVVGNRDVPAVSAQVASSL